MTTKHQEIKWEKGYETGIEKIDEQHHILVNTLDEANRRLSQNYSLEVLQSITKDLLSYALYHFEEEEELMQEYLYSEEFSKEYESHLQQHREFSAKVVEIRNSLNSGVLIEQNELISFLLNWLINHINNTDKKLGKFLQEKM